MKKDDLLCPSSPLSGESLLFGILDENAEVNYTEAPIRITDSLLGSFSNISFPKSISVLR